MQSNCCQQLRALHPEVSALNPSAISDLKTQWVVSAISRDLRKFPVLSKSKFCIIWILWCHKKPKVLVLWPSLAVLGRFKDQNFHFLNFLYFLAKKFGNFFPYNFWTIWQENGYIFMFLWNEKHIQRLLAALFQFFPNFNACFTCIYSEIFA